MAHKLYVIPGSHPSECAAAALRIKGIDFRRVYRLPVTSRAQQRLQFPSNRVPALRLEDGEKVVGSREILRRLEELQPDPPLFPADPEERRRVEEAETWGHDVLQPLARRLSWAVLKRTPKAMESYTVGADLPIPPRMAMMGAGMVGRVASRMNHATDEQVQADLRELPDHLDRIDAWISEGVMGGEQANAADLQIGSSLALMLTLGDVRPLIEGRPAADLARRHFGGFPGDAPAGALPAGWAPVPA
jgi:glutathione S-transferase